MITLSGVYVIFGPRGVYVGESADIVRRGTVAQAVRLGLDWTIVKYMPGSSHPERWSAEKTVIDGYRRAGLNVVSTAHLDIGRHHNHRRGWHHSAETKAKIASARSGIYPSPAARQLMSEAQRGERHHNWGKRGPFAGHRHSAEAKAKIAAGVSRARSRNRQLDA